MTNTMLNGASVKRFPQGLKKEFPKGTKHATVLAGIRGNLEPVWHNVGDPQVGLETMYIEFQILVNAMVELLDMGIVDAERLLRGPGDELPGRQVAARPSSDWSSGWLPEPARTAPARTTPTLHLRVWRGTTTRTEPGGNPPRIPPNGI